MSDTVQTNGTGAPDLRALDEAAVLAAAKAEWRATPHPLLPWFNNAQLLALLRQPGGSDRVAQLYAEREERIYLAGDTDGSDPLRFGFELPCWKTADDMAREFKFIYCAGGKRAGKSERAAKRLVQAALQFPRGILWAFQGNAKTSIAAQQTLVWKYLPPTIKALNGKQDRRKIFAVSFSEKNGFADAVLVLPNRTKIHFLTYEMDVKQYQGWQIGSPWRPGMPLTATEAAMQQLMDGTEGDVQNLGFWADEDMPFPWLETCELRAATHGARGLWTFSTTEGITPAIKQVLGTATTLESKPAELLGDRVNLPQLPKGEMPFRQKAERTDWGAIFFFSEFNPFGDNYANVKSFCAGKTSDAIMENAYGYARDTRHKAFPLFGEWNIVKRDHLPKKMTRYMITDPGGASRNWATIWIGVAENGCLYIDRDWPDEQTYGEWAVPSEDPKQPDGNRGPAQRSLGFGYTQLAEHWRKLEAGEEIFDRYIDPRAAANPHLEEEGGTDAYREFAELPEPMIFTGFSGKKMKTGFDAVNELLFWDREKPLSWPTNAPHLYVSEDCKQVRWMLTNFTGLGGDKAGGKDFADLVRGAALADLQFYEDNTLKSFGIGKGY